MVRPLLCCKCHKCGKEHLSTQCREPPDEHMSYDPLDGQENHVACLFCQRGLKEVPWELRQQFHKEAPGESPQFVGVHALVSDELPDQDCMIRFYDCNIDGSLNCHLNIYIHIYIMLIFGWHFRREQT
jgi:hypothetical protein